jgi:hypothetical protein
LQTDGQDVVAGDGTGHGGQLNDERPARGHRRGYRINIVGGRRVDVDEERGGRPVVVEDIRGRTRCLRHNEAPSVRKPRMRAEDGDLYDDFRREPSVPDKP